MGEICNSQRNPNKIKTFDRTNPYGVDYGSSPFGNTQIAPPIDQNLNPYDRYGSVLKFSRPLKEDQIQADLPINPDNQKIAQVAPVPKPVVNIQSPKIAVNTESPKPSVNTQTHKLINPNQTETPKLIVNPQNGFNNDVSKMTNEINKLKEENINLKNNLNISKRMLDEQTNAKIQLEDHEKNTKIIIEQFIKEKNDNIQKLTNLTNENILLKNNLTQKEKEYQILQKKYDEIVPVTVGLNNIGATCYMNATLQSLSNVKELSNYFMNKFKPIDPKKRLSNEYYIVVKNLWDIKNNGKAFSPESFKNTLSQMNPLFAGIAANDSKDLINFLLETFHSELNEPTGKMNNYIITPNDQLNEQRMLGIFLNEMKSTYNSPISTLFYGVLETQSKCTNCNRIKYNFQIYSFIEFPLEQVYNYCLRKNPGNNYITQGIPTVDLYTCFEQYQLLSPMTGDNQIFCNECGRAYDAFYGTLIYSLPHYLIINLNRGKNAVFQCNVKFPELLKLHNFVKYQEGKTVFQLVSVICHYGPSSMGGHFIAYCRHHKDNCWYNYNDSIVTKCTNHKPYLTGMPYILFYKTLDDE